MIQGRLSVRAGAPPPTVCTDAVITHLPDVYSRGLTTRKRCSIQACRINKPAAVLPLITAAATFPPGHGRRTDARENVAHPGERQGRNWRGRGSRFRPPLLPSNMPEGADQCGDFG